MSSITTTDLATPDAVKEPRYFALPDPDDPATMVYFRLPKKPRRFYSPVGLGLEPWPKDAIYGPRRRCRELVPKGLPPKEHEKKRIEYFQICRAWWTKVEETVAADPAKAAKEFSRWAIRCCICGKGLTEEYSKVCGIGPECRKGMGAENLATRFVPQVARVHAKAVAERGDFGQSLFGEQRGEPKNV